jgi:hypothetical protein
VADAAIFPKKAAVNIDQAGEIEQLKQARILTNLQDRYHTIEDAKVKIQSDLSYTGSGYYEYKGFGGQDTQAIFLADIRVRNRDTTTVATGTIPQDQKFLISNKVFFRDSVELVASRRFLRFSGEVRIQSDNPALRESWFAFADTVNPDSVFIPFKENKKLTVGLHYFTTYRLFYSNFLQERRNPKDDKDILLTRGYLTVDPRTKEFRIGPRDKLQKQQYKGDIVSYDDSTRKITSQGLIKYPFHFGLYNKKNASPATHINLSGRWAQYQSSKNANARLFMRFAIEDFPKNALSALKARADGITSMNEDINVEDRLFQESIAEFTDPRPSLRGVGDKGGLLGNLPVVGKDNKKEKKEDKQEAEDKEQTQKQKEAAMAAPNMKKLVGKIDEMVSVKGFDVGQYVEAELVLANLNATWCDSAKTLYASGPVGLVSVAGKSINKKVSGKIALSQGARLPNGNFRPDTISIYLSLSDGGSEYVFFQIIGNRVKCRSSITAFNSRIQDVADKQKKKDPDKQEGARFEVISNTYLEQFISQFSQFILSGCGDEY